ncbi:hypothetical protein HUK80_12465 [Flavobacterium sp. MAH-1]|uniref:Lipoprotein n=1 Tax=Flavobacterium agri TaxID=2743471 RepID=A0A7Y8Y379_9FLAO|nr:hypothetical protein [Flavobacterium agri]NUY81714.1 hypothetical protein [Flavobacterium agri]NYA71738.1 hypothetical protein [Flavobacterium agri]
MFKKLTLLALSYALLSSCASVSDYRIGYNTIDQQLDFRQGKWLLGFIEGPTVAKQEMTAKAKIDLNKISGGRVDYAGDVSLLMAEKTPMNPSKNKLAQMYKGTGYDYFINIHCQGSVAESDKDFTEQDYITYTTSFAEVICEVYDLKKGEVVYRQACSARLNKDTSFASKPVFTVLFIAYGKIIDDIQKRAATLQS